MALSPDLVVANKEENRELDVRRLREAGVRVWVTDIETVPQALTSLGRLFDEGLRWPRPDWLAQATALWTGPLPPVSRRIAIPIWRDPWMVVGSNTFTGDLARRLGLANVYADHPERYPHVDLADLDAAGADVLLLPDEPYLFTPEDGPEAFTRNAHRARQRTAAHVVRPEPAGGAPDVGPLQRTVGHECGALLTIKAWPAWSHE